MSGRGPGARSWRALRWLLGLSAIWAIVAEGAFGGVVAIFSVLLATALALHLSLPPSGRLHLRGVLRFVPFFLARSLRGGLDVAWRALHPRLPLRTGWLEYHTRLPPGAPRLLFSMSISVLPGTLTAERRDGTLHVHLLDTALASAGTLAALETKVAAVFGLELELPSDEVVKR
jgi:multicomponent Na+:H+ antiporter subunit E